MGRARILFCVVLAAVASCVDLLGIESFPIFHDAGAPDGSAEASALPDCRDTRCASGCGHSFCDDFEGDAGFSRWSIPSELLGQIIATEGSKVTIVADGSNSRNALQITADHGDAAVGVAMLASVLDSGPSPDRFDGMRLEFDLRVDSLDVGVNGPVPDAGGSAMIAGLASRTGGPLGAGGALYITGTSFYIVTATNLTDSATARATPIDKFLRVSDATTSWFHWSLFVGTPERALALGIAGCPATSLIIAATAFGILPTCTSIEVDGGTEPWPRPMVFVGSSVERGVLRYRVDNVTVDSFTR